MSLFDYRASYPDAPGFTNQTTSRQAAAEVEICAKTLRGMALRAVEAAGAYGITTNELSDSLRVDRGSIQPRTSELKAAGKIVDSGDRRRNANGKLAIVWRLA